MELIKLVRQKNTVLCDCKKSKKPMASLSPDLVYSVREWKTIEPFRVLSNIPVKLYQNCLLLPSFESHQGFPVVRPAGAEPKVHKKVKPVESLCRHPTVFNTVVQTQQKTTVHSSQFIVPSWSQEGELEIPSLSIHVFVHVVGMISCKIIEVLTSTLVSVYI